MESAFIDLQLSDLGLLSAQEASLCFDVAGEHRVLLGLSYPPGNGWSYGPDPGGPSPMDENPQDSMWLEDSDVVITERETFGLSALDGKLSSSSWCDEPMPFQALFQSFPLHDVNKFEISNSSIVSTSPIDGRFEIGDIYNNQQLLLDALPIDNFSESQIFSSQPMQEIQEYTSVKVIEPLFSVGSYDQVLSPAYSPDCFVPTSPKAEDSQPYFDSEILADFQPLYFDSKVSEASLPLFDDDALLHDDADVCRLLRELSDCAHVDSTALSHVSCEEVESVLSRDSSSENLLSLDDTDDYLTGYTTDTGVSGGQFSLVVSSNSTIGSHTASSALIGPMVSHSSSTGPVVSRSLGSIVSSSLITDNLSSSSLSLLSLDYQGALLSSKHPVTRAVDSAPYQILSERRVRKKEQNKTAALRYRQKKREEKGHTMTEVEELEQQNAKLKNRADELSKEIGYLRGLLEEITRV